METPTIIPDGLRTDGTASWTDIVGTYTFRADELRIVEATARTLDDLAILEAAAVDAKPIVDGHAGQPRPNPVFGEIRATRLLLSKLVTQLGLPDEVETIKKARSGQARRAARVPWGA
ncbi:hypothetical protein C5E07_13045 [Pseudoclavibacter sp. RFBJ3]|uniref:hypothetical protein n=1 Tax=unclassified Pseudoclavibacter TaxID=2615177 RepID=UPI000CE92470|nr:MULTISPECIES: hypothetical protein [unclassified Pseudoclavibacter]PPF82617.1 hypothetical protein C5C12_12120 [Pseudoclavibacter sp. RFBJ5]PPF91511.1 hypothetical protein C5E07_13045 [Pseudoclavibacter sp. RFBJ3]PPF96434.1 hypothetical protein C5C19_15735 [Pseudoclavibacter sp. RFBH5]PPG22179.1 hypothetical protein C5E13_12370 [Pseudoclavibacter sp. RFBI4]